MAATTLTWKDIGTVAGIHSAIALVCFAVFSILRSKHYTRKYYAPKLYDKNQKHKPTRLPSSFFGWIWPVLSYDEDGVIGVSGLDIAVYLRILKLGINISLSLAIVCLPVLVPLHVTSDGLGAAMRDVEVWNSKVDAYSNITKAGGSIKPADCKWESRSRREELMTADIDQTYMTNLQKSTKDNPNHRLWAHLVIAYYVVLVVIYWLNNFNLDITNLRVKFLATVPRGGPSHTALITDIPGVKSGTVVHTLNKAMNSTVLRVAPKSVKTKINTMLEDTADLALKGVDTVGGKAIAMFDERDMDMEMDDSMLNDAQRALRKALADPWASASAYLEQGGDFNGLVTREMEEIFGAEKVVAVNPVYNQEELQPIHAKYDQVKGQLEDLVDDYLGKIKQHRDPEKISKRETGVLGPMYGAWGIERYGTTKRVKVDTLDFLCDYLEECKRQVREAEAPAMQDPTCSAFVTFSTRVAHTTASTSLMNQSEMVWRGQSAPGPEEVVWTNLHMRFWERNLRNLAMWALFITIVLTFTIVCGALQLLVVGPVAVKMDPITKLPVVGAIIQGILPTIVLKIFLILLPMILARMQRFAGCISESEIDFGVVTKFYWFQFATVFIGAVIGGALLDQVKFIINNPNQGTTIVENLFNAIPTKASFFINFILLQGLASKSISLLRIVGLILFFVFSKLAATERARTRLWADQKTGMGTAVADHTIVMLLMITFSVPSPVILAFGFLYFLVTSITERYQMMYVYRLPYESGGKMWKSVFSQVMVAVYTFLITISFLLGSKGFTFTPLIIPAFCIVLLFHMQTLKMFKRPWVVMSLRSAALLDNVERQSGFGEIDDQEKAIICQTYLSPVFKVSDEEHQELLREAARVRQYFNGELQYTDMMLDDEDVAEQPTTKGGVTSS